MADMLAKEFYIATLITAELEGSLGEQEARELEAWKAASPENLKFYQGLIAEEYFLQEFKSFNHADTESIWKLTEAGLHVQPVSDEAHTLAGTIRLWPRIAGIAAAVALLIFTVYFFNAVYRSGNTQQTEYAKGSADIRPGKNGATITLATGKVISLSDDQSGVVIGSDRLAYTDGTAVATDGEAKLQEEKLTATTAKGQTYGFTLPDGTKVWLNADSRISFARQFTKKTRELFLEGEAYFEVAKDKKHPFIVATNGQQIEVLGTHFNVNSYKDESGTATTLLEGSVKIKAGNQQKIITPGQQAFNRSGTIAIRDVDVDNVLDWKNGDFYLNHIEFKTAMRKIARWYDMEIIYDASVPDNMESGGWISRDKPLSAVLKSIESSGLVKFKVEGRKIYVMQ